MDHMDKALAKGPEGVPDMQHLIKLRVKGYSFRMITLDVLVCAPNPWTGRPFRREIKLRLNTRNDAEALAATKL